MKTGQNLLNFKTVWCYHWIARPFYLHKEAFQVVQALQST